MIYIWIFWKSKHLTFETKRGFIGKIVKNNADLVFKNPLQPIIDWIMLKCPAIYKKDLEHIEIVCTLAVIIPQINALQ